MTRRARKRREWAPEPSARSSERPRQRAARWDVPTAETEAQNSEPPGRCTDSL